MKLDPDCKNRGVKITPAPVVLNVLSHGVHIGWVAEYEYDWFVFNTLQCIALTVGAEHHT